MIQSGTLDRINQNKKVEPYMDFIELRSKTIASAGKLAFIFTKPSKLQKQIAISNIPCKVKKGGLPIVVFSHGITGSRHLHQRFLNIYQAMDIVVALDHSYDCNLTIFPDGRIADYRSEITGHPDSINIRQSTNQHEEQRILFLF